MNKYLLFFSTMILFTTCDKEKFFDGPNFYEDDFELYRELDDTLVGRDSLWSFTQLTAENNRIVIDTTNVFSGKQALRFEAEKSSEATLSKCSIAKQRMAFWEGETVRITADYFIAGEARHDWLFLLDIEERTPIGAGPGMRLALVDEQLRVEYKFLEDDILQTSGEEVSLPRNEWVELIWEIHLDTGNNGTVRLWQNGDLIINADQLTTLPTDILYAQQGTKGMYSSVEIGITANSTDDDLVIWVDDVSFEVI